MPEERAVPDTEDEDGPEIVYVPPIVASNYYDGGFDTIVLDERLKEFPEVEQKVIEHEKKHAEYGYRPVGAAKNLIVEFKIDLFHYFSTSEVAKKSRKYRKTGPEGEYSDVEAVLSNLVQIVRLLWTTVMAPTGWLYRRIRAAAEASSIRVPSSGGWFR